MSGLAATFVEAMRLWDRQKEEGVSLDARLQGLEKTLRAAWPQRREWKYLCAACNDHGLIISVVDEGEGYGAYDVGRPCHCAKGDRFRTPTRVDADAFQQAGKTRKMTRVGR